MPKLFLAKISTVFLKDLVFTSLRDGGVVCKGDVSSKDLGLQQEHFRGIFRFVKVNKN